MESELSAGEQLAELKRAEVLAYTRMPTPWRWHKWLVGLQAGLMVVSWAHSFWLFQAVCLASLATTSVVAKRNGVPRLAPRGLPKALRGRPWVEVAIVAAAIGIFVFCWWIGGWKIAAPMAAAITAGLTHWKHRHWARLVRRVREDAGIEPVNP